MELLVNLEVVATYQLSDPTLMINRTAVPRTQVTAWKSAGFRGKIDQPRINPEKHLSSDDGLHLQDNI